MSVVNKSMAESIMGHLLHQRTSSNEIKDGGGVSELKKTESIRAS